MSKPTRTIHIAALHSDYLLEQMSSHYYELGPNHRHQDGVYVTVAFNPPLCFDIMDDVTVPPQLIKELSIYAKNFYGPNDYDALTYYHICIVGENAAEDWFNRCVDEMIRRIPWLECEDDHVDFYHSTVEVLIQFAIECDLIHELERLFDAIERDHEQNCQYDGQGQCSILHLLAPYVYNR